MSFMCCLCKCVSRDEPSRIFHTFPEKKTLRNEWLRISKRSEGNLGRTTSICSLHFPKSSYNVNKGKRELKDDAIPTLHLILTPGGKNKIAPKSIIKKSLKVPVSKCAKCSRQFPSASALKTHIIRNHGKRALSLRRKSVKTMERVKSVRILGSRAKNMAKTVTEEETKPTQQQKKIKFECPKCTQTFNMFFPALKHIQNTHCVDKDGKEVSPTSKDLIQPISVDHCVFCSKYYRTNDEHICLNKDSAEDKYLCLGCDQTFKTLSLYEVHLKNLHKEKRHNFYFQDSNEFAAWKLDVEKQTKSKYVKLNENTPKQMYYCTYQPVTTTGNITTTELCPSSILVKKLTKGIQVTYYGDHTSHPSEEYEIPQIYKGKCINHYLEGAEEMEDVLADDKDLYVQFKKLMSSIVLDAAKLNIPTLNKLTEKALEMTMLLNGFDEEAEPIVQTTLMTETQVEDILAKGNKKKRKQNFDVKSENENVNKVNGESPAKKPLVDDTPSSFNDSYKNFVSSVTKPAVSKKKEVVKTKIGQFKPSPPKKIVSNNKESPQSVLSVNKKDDLPKRTVRKTMEDDNIWKVKPDTEYEIIEQENDCNILVLKI